MKNQPRETHDRSPCVRHILDISIHLSLGALPPSLPPPPSSITAGGKEEQVCAVRAHGGTKPAVIGVIYQASCPSYFCGEVDHRVMGGGSNYGSRIEVESRLIVEEVVFWRVWQIGSSVSGCWSVEYTCFAVRGRIMCIFL